MGDGTLPSDRQYNFSRQRSAHLGTAIANDYIAAPLTFPKTAFDRQFLAQELSNGGV